jgi:hypothetical protein
MMASKQALHQVSKSKSIWAANLATNKALCAQLYNPERRYGNDYFTFKITGQQYITPVVIKPASESKQLEGALIFFRFSYHTRRLAFCRYIVTVLASE